MPIPRLPAALALAAVALVIAGLPAVPAMAQRSGFQVVVHESNPVSSLNADQLSEIFLKRTGKWQHGEEAKPVDQVPSSRVRSRFSREVFGKEVAWIKSYWQKQIFSGRSTPPPELDSNEAVLSFVRRNPGAIGYVDPSVALGADVKAVTFVQ